MKVIVRHAVIGLVPVKGGVDYWGKTRRYERKWTAYEVEADPHGTMAKEIVRREGRATITRIGGIDYLHVAKTVFPDKRAMDRWLRETEAEVVSYGERR